MVAKNEANSFQQLNEEVNEFYKYLKENKYTDKEIRKLLQPLTTIPKKASFLKYIISVIVLLGLFIYSCVHCETVSWHVTAILRILMIKLLPYWNWEALKNEQCLITKFGPTSTEITPQETLFNCDICETVSILDAYDTLDSITMKIRYLDLDLPVILTNATNGWPQDPRELVSSVSSNKELRSSYPCTVSSNIVNGRTTVGKLLDRTGYFENFFVHFQNCDVQAVKNFRTHVPRPPFLENVELAPIQMSWLLWSRNYNVTNYKMVDLVHKVAVVGQISGATYLRLTPKSNCENICNVLTVKLSKGETLLLTSLWDLEYRPEETGENVAVILETN